MKYKSVKGLLTNYESLIPATFIDKLEDILYCFLGIVLFVISVLAAGYTLQRLIETRPFFPLGKSNGINDILINYMVAGEGFEPSKVLGFTDLDRVPWQIIYPLTVKK